MAYFLCLLVKRTLKSSSLIQFFKIKKPTTKQKSFKGTIEDDLSQLFDVYSLAMLQGVFSISLVFPMFSNS